MKNVICGDFCILQGSYLVKRKNSRLLLMMSLTFGQVNLTACFSSTKIQISIRAGQFIFLQIKLSVIIYRC